MKNTPNARDEFDKMIDWGRDLTDIWTQLKWLQAFALINRKATKNCMEKFMKNFFKVTDNTFDKQLAGFVKTRSFVLENRYTKEKGRGRVQVLSRDVLAFYSTAFTDGNVKEALVQVGKKDR